MMHRLSSFPRSSGRGKKYLEKIQMVFILSPYYIYYSAIFKLFFVYYYTRKHTSILMNKDTTDSSWVDGYKVFSRFCYNKNHSSALSLFLSPSCAFPSSPTEKKKGCLTKSLYEHSKSIITFFVFLFSNTVCRLCP